ncbi:MAG: alpha/beta fold hydrolase [Ilumatobacteraceae bacterium]
MMVKTIIGAESWSHIGTSDVGVLVVHGFTGSPGSMRALAQACADAGFHVELPQLKGHGTDVADMMPTRWSDWSADTEAAYQKLRQRCSRIIVIGLSMGGTLTLWLAARHPDIAGVVCINPLAQPLADEMLSGLEALISGGVETMSSIGSDIADPSAKEISYDSTPTAPLLSLFVDGVSDIATKYSAITVPMLLLNSVTDHVVDPQQSDFLVERYGGKIERVMLEHSFHVATQDYDKLIINEKAIAFARRVTKS